MRFPAALAWAGSTQIIVVGISIVVSAITARTLGPEGFGALAFYLSVGYLAAPLAKWGLDLTLTRHAVAAQSSGRQLVVAALTARFFTGIFAFLLTLGLALLLRNQQGDVWSIGLPILLSIIIGSGTVMSSAYQGAGRWDINSKIAIISSIALLGLTLALSATTTDPVLFAVARTLEAFAATVASLAFLGALMNRGHATTSLTPVLLLREGFPFVASGIAVALYSRLDQVLIAYLIDDRALGQYAVAAQIVFGWWAISSILVLVIRPAIIASNSSPESLELAVRTGFDIAVVFGYLAIVATLLCGYPLIVFVFGKEFLDALPALMLLSLTIPWAALGGMRTSYMVARSQDNLYFLMSLIGLGVAFVFNLALIPLFGIGGAALAAVCAHAAAVLGSCFLFSETRKVGNIMIKSMLWPKHAFNLDRLRSILTSPDRSATAST